MLEFLYARHHSSKLNERWYSAQYDFYFIVREIMDSYGLNDWKLEFENLPDTAAFCDRKKRYIALCPMVFGEGVWLSESFIETIAKHEVAHALTKGFHGSAWQKKIIEMGLEEHLRWMNQRHLV